MAGLNQLSTLTFHRSSTADNSVDAMVNHAISQAVDPQVLEGSKSNGSTSTGTPGIPNKDYENTALFRQLIKATPPFQEEEFNDPQRSPMMLDLNRWTAVPNPRSGSYSEGPSSACSEDSSSNSSFSSQQTQPSPFSQPLVSMSDMLIENLDKGSDSVFDFDMDLGQRGLSFNDMYNSINIELNAGSGTGRSQTGNYQQQPQQQQTVQQHHSQGSACAFSVANNQYFSTNGPSTSSSIPMNQQQQAQQDSLWFNEQPQVWNIAQTQVQQNNMSSNGIVQYTPVMQQQGMANAGTQQQQQGLFEAVPHQQQEAWNGTASNSTCDFTILNMTTDLVQPFGQLQPQYQQQGNWGTAQTQTQIPGLQQQLKLNYHVPTPPPYQLPKQHSAPMKVERSSPPGGTNSAGQQQAQQTRPNGLQRPQSQQGSSGSALKATYHYLPPQSKQAANPKSVVSVASLIQQNNSKIASIVQEAKKGSEGWKQPPTRYYIVENNAAVLETNPRPPVSKFSQLQGGSQVVRGRQVRLLATTTTVAAGGGGRGEIRTRGGSQVRFRSLPTTAGTPSGNGTVTTISLPAQLNTTPRAAGSGRTGLKLLASDPAKALKEMIQLKLIVLAHQKRLHEVVKQVETYRTAMVINEGNSGSGQRKNEDSDSTTSTDQSPEPKMLNGCLSP